MNKIFVGNLNFSVTESVLEAFIRENGIEVQNVNMPRDFDTGRSRGFGFVELANEQDVDEAISVLNGKILEDRAIRVDRARERTRRSPQGRRSRRRTW